MSRITDPKAFGKVAVLMGGASAEREISLQSGQAVLAALKRRGVNAVEVEVGKYPLPPLLDQDFDRVFNCLHGRGGEDGVLQGALEAIDLPYTGSGILGSALSMDKVSCKLCWRGAGLPTPEWVMLASEADLAQCADQLGFPVIIKPALEGSSLGMSKAEDIESLKQAWLKAKEFGCQVFAERWIEGEEYTVGMLQEAMLPLIKLETPRTFYDYEAKYRAGTTRYLCPCGLPSFREEALQTLAKKACDILGVRGWGRVDLFLDGGGQPWLIEVNTVPGMTDHSLVPMAAKAAGMEMDELAWRILETSFDET